MKINYSEYSGAGGREINEDMLAVVCPQGRLLALAADGLGGLQNGHLASMSAVNVISDCLMHQAPDQEQLKEAILQANYAVLERQKTDGRMMTTIAALWMDDKKAFAAHVGDTRLYQFRQGKIIFQTEDHSMSQLAVRMGEITQEEIRGHAARNQIIRAVGGDQELSVQTQALDVRQGDAFLLCTDGFWELVWEKEMLACLAAAECAEGWLHAMLKLLAQRLDEASDNYTAIAVMM